MSNEYVYPSNHIYKVDRGITRLDRSADRIAASIVGSEEFKADPFEMIAKFSYGLAEALIAESNKRKEAA